MERDVTVTEKYLLPIFLQEYHILRRMRMCCKIFQVGLGNLQEVEDIVIIFKVPLGESKMLDAIRNSFSKHLDVLRQEEYYNKDCIVSYDEGEFTFHAVSLNIETKFYEKVNKFLEGRYSEMFKDEELESLSSLFINYIDISKVLSKNRDYLPNFVAHLNKMFNTSLTIEDYEDVDLELEVPPLVSTDLIILECQD